MTVQGARYCGECDNCGTVIEQMLEGSFLKYPPDTIEVTCLCDQPLTLRLEAVVQGPRRLL